MVRSANILAEEERLLKREQKIVIVSRKTKLRNLEKIKKISKQIKKKLIKRSKKCKPFVKNKKSLEDNRNSKMKRMPRPKKLRFRRKLTWIMLLSIFNTSGTGIRPKASS